MSACFVMCLTFGCQALTMVFEFFDQMREVDTCCKCIKTLSELLDGTFVYRGVTLVSACLSCMQCVVVQH